MGIQVLHYVISLTTNGNKFLKLTHELLFEKKDVHDMLDIVCNINSALSKCCLLYKC